MNKKAYYYVVQVYPRGDDVHKYFKAVSKKQIRQHLNNTGFDAINIYDPSTKPAEGVSYADITKVAVEV